MSDFLSSLAARALHPVAEVRPQLPSRFEEPAAISIPMRGFGRPEEDLREETVVEPEPPSGRGNVAARIERLQAILPTPPAGASPSAGRPQGFAPIREAAPRGSDVREENIESPAPVTPRFLHKSPPREAAARPNAPVEIVRAADAPAPLRPVAGEQPPRATVGDPSRTPHPAPADDRAPRLSPANAAIVPALALEIAAKWRASSAAAASPAAGSSSEPAPRVIQVTIGRVEIRAAPASPSRARAASESASRAASLSEYLQRPTGSRP